MRQVTVFVNDYPAKRRVGIGFTAEDYDNVDKLWDVEDERLTALQGIPVFTGYTTWSKCRTEHLRVLIARTMVVMDESTDAERADPEDPATSTLNFLILCLVKCLETAAQVTIELFHINRMSKTDIAYDFTAVMDLKFGPPPLLDDGNPFKIVVDNTK